MKKINFNTMLLALIIAASSGVASASVADIVSSVDVSSINMKFVTKTVNDFNNMLGSLDPNASNLGDVIQPQLDLLIKYVGIYIDTKAPKSTKSALKLALNELSKFSSKSLASLNNNSDVSKNKKQIADLTKYVAGLSAALTMAQMFGAK